MITGSYVNGRTNPTIYSSFFPGVSPGYKIIETPANLVYLPIILDRISSMETTLTDQNGTLLNLLNLMFRSDFTYEKFKYYLNIFITYIKCT